MMAANRWAGIEAIQSSRISAGVRTSQMEEPYHQEVEMGLRADDGKSFLKAERLQGCVCLS
ncbi:hypothetical protein FEM03_02355 [Phragmitibacter flavus]|uniref:Uncharacterized protein n=1 Tax=Phragmitibacter flavus TaxID=2576071 RepID=A0A5R8KKS1_9BACT|nr:hypothetical protein FEM03_02355 [Phragmitibacter flavus]